MSCALAERALNAAANVSMMIVRIASMIMKFGTQRLPLGELPKFQPQRELERARLLA